MKTNKDTKTEIDNSLDLIQPQGERIDIMIGEKSYKFIVVDFLFGDIGRVIGLIMSFGIAFDKLDRNDVALAASLMATKIETVHEIIQIALNKQLDQQGITGETNQIQWIKNLRGIDGVRLASKLVKVNYDFFFQAKEIVMTDFPMLATMTLGATKSATTANKTQADTTTELTSDSVS